MTGLIASKVATRRLNAPILFCIRSDREISRSRGTAGTDCDRVIGALMVVEAVVTPVMAVPVRVATLIAFAKTELMRGRGSETKNYE